MNMVQIEEKRELSDTLLRMNQSSTEEDKIKGRLKDKLEQDEQIDGIYKDGISSKITVSILGYRLNFVQKAKPIKNFDIEQNPDKFYDA